MKGRGVFTTLMSGIIGILLTGVFLLLSLHFSFFNPDIIDYALTKSDYVGELAQDIRLNTQSILSENRLSEAMIDEALNSYDLRSEVISYFSLKIQGIEAEIDSKSFSDYILKNVRETLITRQITGEELEISVQEITGDLVNAFKAPFVYPKLTGLLHESATYKKMINNIMYAFVILLVAFAVIMIMTKEKKWWLLYYRGFWVTALAGTVIGVFLSLFKYKDENLSYASLINSILAFSGLLLLLGSLALLYLLALPMLYRMAKKIAVKRAEKRKVK